MTAPLRIAMWSGPRNLSTALMYAFAARGDTAVWDEPFYAAYLAATGIVHPMRAEVIAAGQTDPRAVAAACAGPVPAGRRVFYQKHMCQHMIAGFPRDFMAACTNVFLIRHPARVIASYTAKRENPVAADLGFALQSELFDAAKAVQGPVPVVDTTALRADPAGVLRRLCVAVGLDFRPAMLAWPAGGHSSDGVWAAHWYGAVHRSTGFDAPEGPLPQVPEALRPLLDEALPHYERLRREAL